MTPTERRAYQANRTRDLKGRFCPCSRPAVDYKGGFVCAFCLRAEETMKTEKKIGHRL